MFMATILLIVDSWEGTSEVIQDPTTPFTYRVLPWLFVGASLGILGDETTHK